MKKGMLVLAVVLYACSLFSFCYYVKLELDVYYLMTLTERFTYLLLACLLLYGGSIVLVKVSNENSKKIMTITFQIFFAFYVILMITITLFDPLLRSGSTRVVFDFELVSEYIKETANVRPFRMILLYWNGLNSGLLSLSVYLMNIVGNLVVMMPLAFFLPMLSKTFKKFIPFVITVTIVILSIESLQAITMSGYFDVDDIMLNLVGALIMFYFLRIPFVGLWVSELSCGSITIHGRKKND
jgi:Glycopeptide antibiotics resistance protein